MQSIKVIFSRLKKKKESFILSKWHYYNMKGKSLSFQTFPFSTGFICLTFQQKSQTHTHTTLSPSLHRCMVVTWQIWSKIKLSSWFSSWFIMVCVSRGTLLMKKWSVKFYLFKVRSKVAKRHFAKIPWWRTLKARRQQATPQRMVAILNARDVQDSQEKGGAPKKDQFPAHLKEDRMGKTRRPHQLPISQLFLLCVSRDQTRSRMAEHT